MRVGLTLPTVRESASYALDAAIAAEHAGIDGVFVFDHINQRRGSAPSLSCWPLLGAVAALTTSTRIGTLVARVTLMTPAMLARQFDTLARLGPTARDRLIAGLGIGDRGSADENAAVGVPFPGRADRIGQLCEAVALLRIVGVETWIGGLSRDLWEIARHTSTPLNLWDPTPATLNSARATLGEVSWAGPVGRETVAQSLEIARAAGASWAICTPSYRIEGVHEAVRMVAEAAAGVRR